MLLVRSALRCSARLDVAGGEGGEQLRSGAEGAVPAVVQIVCVPEGTESGLEGGCVKVCTEEA